MHLKPNLFTYLKKSVDNDPVQTLPLFFDRFPQENLLIQYNQNTS